jgi:hypothetical protein
MILRNAFVKQYKQEYKRPKKELGKQTGIDFRKVGVDLITLMLETSLQSNTTSFTTCWN